MIALLCFLAGALIGLLGESVTVDQGWLNITVISEGGQVIYTDSICLPGCTQYPVPGGSH